MLYEKSNRPPREGSLKEALFLTVRLRQQEAQIHLARIMAQGLASTATAAGGSAEGISEAFKGYVAAMLPFTEGMQKDTDKKMKEVMEKEAKKGPLFFTPQIADPFRDRAKKIILDEGFRKKIREASEARKSRK